MTTTPSEAQRRYNTLTQRIEALDTDLGRTIDSEQKLGLEQRRAALVADRDAVMSEMIANDRRGNGDLETLIHNVNRLGSVLASDHPAEAHAIIEECVNALTRLDNRVLGLEGRVSAIEQHIHPPWGVTFLRFWAVFAILFGLCLGAWQYAAFVLYPVIAASLEAVIAALAIVLLVFANVKLKERRP